MSSTLQVTLGEARSVLADRAAAFALTAVVLLLTAFLACLLPARRAAGVEPNEALRAE